MTDILDEKVEPSTTTPEGEVENEVVTPPTPTEEELAWNALSGKAQERFSDAVKRAKTFEEETARLRAELARKDAERVSTPSTPNGEVQEAVRVLRQGGMVTTDDLYAIIGDLNKNQAHRDLQSKYDGSNDLPKYDSVEVEDYAQRKGFGANFEAAFREMYFDEFVDHARRERKSPKSPVTEKPSASSTNKEEPLTLEKIRQNLKDPVWYDKHVKSDPAKFDQLVRDLSSS